VVQGQVAVFRHPDGADPNDGQVWVFWPLADTGDATVEIPVRRPQVNVVSVDGESQTLLANAGRVRLELKGDSKMAQAVLIIDRSTEQPGK
jgi:hypothetical protein